jgi:hypothetical protein
MKYYATFGFGQPNENRYVVIDDCPDMDTARETMFSIWGRVWSFVYDGDEWDAEFTKQVGMKSLPFKISLNVAVESKAMASFNICRHGCIDGRCTTCAVEIEREVILKELQEMFTKKETSMSAFDVAHNFTIEKIIDLIRKRI